MGKLVADIIDVLAPYLGSCILVMGEPKLLNLQER